MTVRMKVSGGGAHLGFSSLDGIEMPVLSFGVNFMIPIAELLDGLLKFRHADDSASLKLVSSAVSPSLDKTYYGNIDCCDVSCVESSADGDDWTVLDSSIGNDHIVRVVSPETIGPTTMCSAIDGFLATAGSSEESKSSYFAAVPVDPLFSDDPWSTSKSSRVGGVENDGRNTLKLSQLIPAQVVHAADELVKCESDEANNKWVVGKDPGVFNAPYGVGTQQAAKLKEDVLRTLAADGKPVSFGSLHTRVGLGLRFNQTFFQKRSVNNGSWKKWLASLPELEILRDPSLVAHHGCHATHVHLKRNSTVSNYPSLVACIESSRSQSEVTLNGDLGAAEFEASLEFSPSYISELLKNYFSLWRRVTLASAECTKAESAQAEAICSMQPRNESEKYESFVSKNVKAYDDKNFVVRRCAEPHNVFKPCYGIGTQEAAQLQQDILHVLALADGNVLDIGSIHSQTDLGSRFNHIFFHKKKGVNNGSWKKWLSALPDVELLYDSKHSACVRLGRQAAASVVLTGKQGSTACQAMLLEVPDSKSAPKSLRVGIERTAGLGKRNCHKSPAKARRDIRRIQAKREAFPDRDDGAAKRSHASCLNSVRGARGSASSCTMCFDAWRTSICHDGAALPSGMSRMIIPLEPELKGSVYADAQARLNLLCGPWMDQFGSMYVLSFAEKVGMLDVCTRRPTGQMFTTRGLIQCRQHDIYWGHSKCQFKLSGFENGRVTWKCSKRSNDFVWVRAPAAVKTLVAAAEKLRQQSDASTFPVSLGIPPGMPPVFHGPMLNPVAFTMSICWLREQLEQRKKQQEPCSIEGAMGGSNIEITAEPTEHSELQSPDRVHDSI